MRAMAVAPSSIFHVQTWQSGKHSANSAKLPDCVTVQAQIHHALHYNGFGNDVQLEVAVIGGCHGEALCSRFLFIVVVVIIITTLLLLLLVVAVEPHLLG